MRATASSATPSRISEEHALYDPLHYVLYYPYGGKGWYKGMGITIQKYYSYRLMVRDHSNEPIRADILHYGGPLFQQYIVDEAVKLQDSRLGYLASKTGQNQIRADRYNSLRQGLAETADDEPHLGRSIILPSSYIGGPRYMREIYQDAMAIVRDKGGPSLFITMTTNPKWTEIVNSVKINQVAADRPDIVARTFNCKIKEFLHDMIQRQILGVVIAYTWVVEYQKRGLPHLHSLFILHPSSKPRTPDDYDIMVSAEIPNQATNPILHNIVMEHNIHTCSPSRCLDTNNCCKHRFPKDFCAATEQGEDSYPTYQRRPAKDGGNDLNQNVVPYNPWLTLKYNCHMNVEIASSVKSKAHIYSRNPFVLMFFTRFQIHLQICDEGLR